MTKTLSSLLTPTGRLPEFLRLYSIWERTKDGTKPIPIYDPEARCVWRIVGSGIREIPADAPNTKKVLDVLLGEGIAPLTASSASAANASANIIGARFLDGGIAGVTGDYWYGERGVWIWGPELVRFVAGKLGLAITQRHEAHFTTA